MTSVAPRSRGRTTGTARSLNELRERYLRRARFLLMDMGFRSRVAAYREAWNGTPGLPSVTQIIPSDHPFAFEAPHMLTLRDELMTIHGGDLFAVLESMKIPMHLWAMTVRTLESVAFPVEDFATPITFGSLYHSPLQRFIEVALCLSSEGMSFLASAEGSALLEAMMPTPSLDLFPMIIEGESHAVCWVVPVYPDMTVGDLEAAIPAIMQGVRDKLGSRSVDARMQAMHDAGIQTKEIADALGVEHPTVLERLARHGKRKPIKRPRAQKKRRSL